MLGRAYALELLDLIENPLKSKKLNKRTFGCIASEIAHRAHSMNNDGLYWVFFETISEQLISLFRGPIPLANDQTHIGTHVTVALDKEVRVALSEAAPSDREAMTVILVSNLGNQVRAQYDPSKIGQFALKVVGTMSILHG